jgi:hypothetical protein
MKSKYGYMGLGQVVRTLPCLCRELRRKHDDILDKQITERRRVFEMRHALALDGLHESRLRDALAL